MTAEAMASSERPRAKTRKPPEMKKRTSKSNKEPARRALLGQIMMYLGCATLLILLGIYSNVSQLALTPVYGSVAASSWHPHTLILGCFAGWAGNLALRRLLPVRTSKLIPLLALCIPTIQFYLFRFSQPLGTFWGPAVTEGATLVPLAALTASSVADQLEAAELSWMPGFVAEAAPGVLSWAVLRWSEGVAGAYLRIRVGTAFWYTRMGMEIALGGVYAVLAPSVYLVLTVPALLHTALVNTHVATPAGTAALNGTMREAGWMLLDRRESLTGYISVTQSGDMARVLRADHSILGGDWVDFRGGEVTEPVYSVFVMLEAVRLVEREEGGDASANALVIGLGIGNLPSALVTHGIETTVVEIDPAVYDFARKYFQLRENNPAVIEDAVTYAARLVREGHRQFDYIVHDVFTGGAEPVELFTLEFLRNIHALLKDDGVVAINYAGDLVLPTPKIILQTILSVFPTCRIFRENPRDDDIFAKTGSDFTNMVVFCLKKDKPLVFREPVEADYLASRGRYAYLQPRHELLAQDLFEDRSYDVLRAGETERVMAWHRRSATGHWAIMRNVLPASFWENW